MTKVFYVSFLSSSFIFFIFITLLSHRWEIRVASSQWKASSNGVTLPRCLRI
ncbi:hypothetical protein V1264_017388 [Littorina saxatilis]|uniref:Uncharacterized protein n=1 Tax=Littorina saxatilis TaxID=31220 RepID=A0AAN9BH40_9CAEN